MKTERSKVFDAIEKERQYQQERWGDLDDRNNVADFLAYMKRYFDKAFVENNPDHPSNSLTAIRKVVTLGVAAMEKFGVGE